MDCSKLNKKETIERIIALVHKGQSGGAYQIDEAKLLDSAISYFDPNIAEEDRPKLTNDQRDQGAVAYDVLRQAVLVAQRRGNNAFTLKDAAMGFDLLQHMEVLNQSASASSSADASTTKGKGKAKTVLPKVEELAEASSEEDVEEVEEDIPQPRRRR